MYNGLPRFCRTPRHVLQVTRPTAVRRIAQPSPLSLRLCRSVQTTKNPNTKKSATKTPATKNKPSHRTPPPHPPPATRSSSTPTPPRKPSASSSSSSSSTSYPRTRKWARRLAYTTALGTTIYLVDTRTNNAALTRSLHTFGTGLVIGLDYKINFRAHPPFAASLADVHHRNAERVFHLLRDNGGLYLKIGQAIAMQSAILPPEFQKMFARMFDDASQNEWADVERVVREDFGGRGPEEVFGVSFEGAEGRGVMERTARASASVAQVHWARLADGREVAVKVQKREIAAQVGWDLWAFK